MQQQNIYLYMTSRNTNRPNLHTHAFKIIIKIQIMKNLFKKLAYNEHSKCNWGIIVSFLSSFRKQHSHLLFYYVHITVSLPYELFSPALIPAHLTVENQFKAESIIFRFSFFSQGNITPDTRRALLDLELCSFTQVVVRIVPCFGGQGKHRRHL